MFTLRHPGFYRPRSITTDGTNLYVGDSGTTHTIRKIVISSGVGDNAVAG